MYSNVAIRPSASTLWRKQLKLKDPVKYIAMKQRETERYFERKRMKAAGELSQTHMEAIEQHTLDKK